MHIFRTCFLSFYPNCALKILEFVALSGFRESKALPPVEDRLRNETQQTTALVGFEFKIPCGLNEFQDRSRGFRTSMGHSGSRILGTFTRRELLKLE
jgi:hypothetical protein